MVKKIIKCKHELLSENTNQSIINHQKVETTKQMYADISIERHYYYTDTILEILKLTMEINN